MAARGSQFFISSRYSNSPHSKLSIGDRSVAFRFPSFGRLSASEEETRDAQLVSYARHKSKLQMVAVAMAVMDKTAAAEAAAMEAWGFIF